MNDKLLKLIKKCKKSPKFFIENFCKVRHPKAGVIPFKLFKYQQESINAFQNYKYVIYKKTRQCGISTVSGIYALWYAMFHPHSTVLVVSKRDADAQDFMGKNVWIPYSYLPVEFKNIWKANANMHGINFSNGSSIKCKPSGKDTLRSYSSTLNIIDEAAFMPDMGDMWTGAAPTLAHGGNVIVISTSNGKGNWYYNTWENAINGENDFHPIEINWWDMDWEIKYKDKVSGQNVVLSPTKGIRESTPEEAEKYGPYISPWLVEQYNLLKEEGGERRFRQEVLADFIGSGNTVIPVPTLEYIQTTVTNPTEGTVGFWEYIHPVTGERLQLDYQNQLWIWKRPVTPEADVIENGKIVKKGNPGHSYVLGCDVSTGEANDYSSICVIDVDAMEQVAELNIKIIPSVLTLMVDHLAKWYNNALVVVENTGIGSGVSIDIEQQVGYYNVFRMKNQNGLGRVKRAGFPTSPKYKALLNKALIDMLGPEGFQIYSSRLYKQMGTYIYTNDAGTRTGNEPGANNHDDLVLACALALVGVNDAVQMDVVSLLPSRAKETIQPVMESETENKLREKRDKNIEIKGGTNLLPPFRQDDFQPRGHTTPQQQLDLFTHQLGGLTKEQAAERMSGKVSYKKYIIKK